MPINSVKFSKGLIIGFCIVYFMMGGFLGYFTRKSYILILDYLILDLVKGPFLFQAVLTLVMLFSSIFGLVAALKSSPLLLKIFAFLLLTGLALQVLDHFWLHALQNDLYQLSFKRMMLHFDYLPSYLKEFLQKVQQSNRCCGVDQWRDYGPLPRLVPDSCCGKYFGGNPNNVGSCTFKDLETTSGCGGLLLTADSVPFSTSTSVIYNVFLVLFYGVQALTTTTAWMLSYDLANLVKRPIN